MPSLKSRFFYYAVKRQLRKFALRGGSLEQVRAARDKSSKRMFPAPPGVQVQPAQLGDCPGEWLRPAGASANTVLLYLHGGAYITGSCHTHRGLAGHLAQSAGLDCFLLDYRLAPEHPFPAAVEDAHNAYLALHDQDPARTIVLAGDSAGGGLALALALRLRDAGHAAPGAMALLSPWTDLTLSLPTHQSKATKSSKACGTYGRYLPAVLPRPMPRLSSWGRFCVQLKRQGLSRRKHRAPHVQPCLALELRIVQGHMGGLFIQTRFMLNTAQGAVGLCGLMA